MMMRHSRRRWTSWLVFALGVTLLAGLVAPVGRRALASVTLNYFRATWQPELETVVIEWQTATELNTVGFIVERSLLPDTGFVAITEVISAVGDQFTGWTYDPVADDPSDLVLGTTYWYRLIVINSSPPNDVIDPIGVKAGDPHTLTPTHTATATVTATPSTTPTSSTTPTPSTTPTRTRTPTPTATTQTSTAGPVVTPSVTFVSISGATVTPRPSQPTRATATSVPAGPTVIGTVAPSQRPVSTTTPAVVSPIATPVALASNAQPSTTSTPAPAANLPTLVPTNSTLVAVAPIVVADESTPQPAAAPENTTGPMLALIGAAGVLLLGGVYAIVRQTGK